MSLSHSKACDLGFSCDCAAGETLHDPNYTPRDVDELYSRWTPCDSCEELFCLAHHKHAFECACPSVEELEAEE